eukprot:c14735_g1_i1.p1 GENE.c14735_g1_i1~~c14735_g1_i1.p1  ORF type:complete len:460 (+),score=58.78 c14735_g1_i1:137-1381(+)
MTKTRKKMCQDTSEGEHWEHAETIGVVDCLQILVFSLFCVPKLIVMWPVFFVLFLVPLTIADIFVTCLPTPTPSIQRSCGFWLAFVAFYATALPGLILAVLCLLIDLAIMNLVGFLYVALTCRWRNYLNNCQQLAPFQHGPLIFLFPADILVAIMGQLHRRGVIQFIQPFCRMFLLNAWLKYWVTGNIWMTDLEVRFVTQTSGTMADMELKDVLSTGRQIISDSKLAPEVRKFVRKYVFVPHYPHPPENRSSALGLQFTSRTINMTHSTHLSQWGEIGTRPRESCPFVLSNSCLSPCWRVVLWRNNPYHAVTGFVEANLTTGEPACPERFKGAEHPMLVICGRNYLSSSRSCSFSAVRAERVFNAWLPEFVRTIRTLVLGAEVAEVRHQKLVETGKELYALDPPTIDIPRPENV